MKSKVSKNKRVTTGLHVLGEIYTEDIKALKNLTKTKESISHIIKRHSVQELGSFYYQFSKGGFTGVVSLVESHIAIHTWPELHYLTLDVYLCNYSRNNNKACEKIFGEISQLFQPLQITKKLIRR